LIPGQLHVICGRQLLAASQDSVPQDLSRLLLDYTVLAVSADNTDLTETSLYAHAKTLPISSHTQNCIIMATVAGASILSGVTYTKYKPHSNSSKWPKK